MYHHIYDARLLSCRYVFGASVVSCVGMLLWVFVFVCVLCFCCSNRLFFLCRCFLFLFLCYDDGQGYPVRSAGDALGGLWVAPIGGSGGRGPILVRQGGSC